MATLADVDRNTKKLIAQQKSFFMRWGYNPTVNESRISLMADKSMTREDFNLALMSAKNQFKLVAGACPINNRKNCLMPL